jgi:MinD superfamily P-loop ATPase
MEPTVLGVHDMRRVLEVTKPFGISSGIAVNKYGLNIDMTEGIEEIWKKFGQILNSKTKNKEEKWRLM